MLELGCIAEKSIIIFIAGFISTEIRTVIIFEVFT
jgi:hypothetical protein